MASHLGIDPVQLFIRFLLGLILLSTSLSKLFRLSRFRRTILEYQILPLSFASHKIFLMVVSLVIPIAELLVAFGLVSGLFLRYSIGIACGLLLLFSLAIAVNLIRGRSDLSCHCDGVFSSHRISWWLVGRNCLMIAALLFLYFTPAPPFTLDALFDSPSSYSPVFLNTVLPIALLAFGAVILLYLANYISRLAHLLSS